MTKAEDHYTVKEVLPMDRRIINYYCEPSLKQAKARAKKTGGTITNDVEEKRKSQIAIIKNG